jgi:TPR repeat protein
MTTCSSESGVGVAHQASEKVLAKAKHLNEKANQKYQAGCFEEAIKLYTDALVLPLLPKEELVVLHSNCLAAHLADGNLRSALLDGKEAQHLRPICPKGYFTKGQVLFVQHNWPKGVFLHVCVCVCVTDSMVLIVFVLLSACPGVANAQHTLGKAYMDSLLGKKSLEKALALITCAANTNYPPALNSLGALYKRSHHREAKNKKQAHKYYLAATTCGKTVVMLNLASLYTHGALGVLQDLQRQYVGQLICQKQELGCPKAAAC